MRLVGASLLLACAIGCGGTSAASTDEDDFTVTDFHEDERLPTHGGWLDAPHALAGVGQFDRLPGTVHDGSKCSTMVAIAAAIVGGKERFLSFLDAVSAKRVAHPDDVAIIDDVRTAANDVALTPRHLHMLTEVVVRAYAVEYGATDGQIASMIRASGYASVHIGSSKPALVVDALDDGDISPLDTVVDKEGHVMLLWKDARGTVRLYDSDDVHGSHVMPRGSAPYFARIQSPESVWPPAEKFR